MVEYASWLHFFSIHQPPCEVVTKVHTIQRFILDFVTKYIIHLYTKRLLIHSSGLNVLMQRNIMIAPAR